MKAPLYIPSYEDAAGTDPITPAVAFAGGVPLINQIPVMIDPDDFPVQVWIRDGHLRKSLLTKDASFSSNMVYVGTNIDFNIYYLFPAYFENGYIGWLAWDLINYFTSAIWGRAYDNTQSLGFSPYGKYTFLYSNVTSNRHEKPDGRSDFEVSEQEPTLG